MRKREPAVRGRDRKRMMRLLTAALLAAVMVVAMVQMPGANALDVETENCTVTVNPYGAADAEGYGDRLAADQIKIDLYRVAEAVKIPGVDSYTYSLVAPFDADETLVNGLEGENRAELDTAAKWEELAAKAAQIVLDAEDTEDPIRPAVTATGGVKSEPVKAGLYLLFVQGRRTATQTTVSASGNYTYTFGTELISLPGKDAVEGPPSTSDPGPWIYDMTINLKVGRTPPTPPPGGTPGPQSASLEIVKTLELVHPDTAQLPATFTFHVEATLNGATVKDERRTVTFTEKGDETLTFTDIPVGARVTVTEESSGGSYELVAGDRTQEGVLTAGQVLRMSFTNRDTDTDKKEYVVVNTFTYSKEDGWHWQADPPQPSTAE